MKSRLGPKARVIIRLLLTLCVMVIIAGVVVWVPWRVGAAIEPAGNPVGQWFGGLGIIGMGAALAAVVTIVVVIVGVVVYKTVKEYIL